MLETMNNKNKVMLIDADYGGYFAKEGYYKVDIGMIDATSLPKGYVIAYVVDKDNKKVYKANLLIKSNDGPVSKVPLEKMIRLAMEDSIEEGFYCYECDFDELIGFECQIKVERINDYYNITDVFPMDEELGEYVSEMDQIKQRFPNGIFNRS
ncbi:hypothetical protein [Oceanobacillus massiliensis]|uniref:hypothetical protein n=1 Tax=Oceanobacillus massiliensis TaxID=1465765 RepID=UPI0030162E94